MLMLGVNSTGQCNPFTSGDAAAAADAWCEWTLTQVFTLNETRVLPYYF